MIILIRFILILIHIFGLRARMLFPLVRLNGWINACEQNNILDYVKDFRNLLELDIFLT